MSETSLPSTSQHSYSLEDFQFLWSLPDEIRLDWEASNQALAKHLGIPREALPKDAPMRK